MHGGCGGFSGLSRKWGHLSPHLYREARVTPAPLALLGRMAWQEPRDQLDHQDPPDPPGHQDQDLPRGL